MAYTPTPQLRDSIVAGLGRIARGGSPLAELAHETAPASPSAPEPPAGSSNAPASFTHPLTAGQPHIDIPTGSPGGDALDHQAVNLVQKYLGVKYTWGGESPVTGFDCSGLIQTVWKQLGVNVPRVSQDQWKAGQPVQGSLRPGDAVFFVGSDGTSTAPGHVGLYIGDDKFIEAPHHGASVRVSTLTGRTDYLGARRFA